MKLWVRSQSKLGLYIVDEIYIDERDFGNDDIQYYVMFGQVRLGIYKSKERALEILDEIQNTIIGFENENNYVSTQCYAIYEMPEE